MMPSSLQVRQLTDATLVKHLKQRVSDGQFSLDASLGGPIHEADTYSASPAVLTKSYAHGEGTDQWGGRGKTWYFFTAARHLRTRRSNSERKRSRVIAGGGANGCCTWINEGHKYEVKDEGVTVGYATPLYCGNSNNGYAERCGWTMLEISLHKKEGNNEFVLCAVYRSNRAGGGGAPGDGPVPDAAPYASADGYFLDPAAIGGDAPGAGPVPDAAPYAPADGYALDPAAIGGGASGSGSVPDAAPPYEPADDYALDPAAIGGGASGSRPMNTPTMAIYKRTDPTAVAPTREFVVMKFDGSSIPSAGRLKVVAELVRDISTHKSPVVLLSGMGNTENNILQVLAKAMTCDKDQKVGEYEEFSISKELYLSTAQELGLNSLIVTGSFDELEQHLQHVGETKKLTCMPREYFMSFAERMSTELFFEYLNEVQFQEWELGSFTTSGIDGTELTATTIAKFFGSRELQVWKDELHGVFTCDPKVFTNAIPIPYLTYEEAAELNYLDKQSVQLAMECGISVVIKNSCIPQAPGSVITKIRDISKSKLTGIMLESNITILNIQRTRVLEQNDFVQKALSSLKKFAFWGISLDKVDIWAGNMAIMLVPSKPLNHGLIQLVLDNVDEELKTFATVWQVHGRSVISLIGNSDMSAPILEQALIAVRSIGVKVEKSLQISSKVAKVLLVVPDSDAEQCVQVLHSSFLANGFISEVKGAENVSIVSVDTPATASSGDKRKAEASPDVYHKKTAIGPSCPLEKDRIFDDDLTWDQGFSPLAEVANWMEDCPSTSAGPPSWFPNLRFEEVCC